MKIHMLTILWILLSSLASAQQPANTSNADAPTPAAIKEAEQKLIYTVKEALLISRLERSLAYSGAFFDRNKIAYKGPIYAIPIPERNGAKVIFWYKNPTPKICAAALVDLDNDLIEPIITYLERDPTPAEDSLCWLMKVTIDKIDNDSIYTSLPNTHLTVLPYSTPYGIIVFTFQRSRDLATCIFGGERVFIYNNNDSLIATIKGHNMPTKICVDTLDPSAPQTGIAYHHHEFKNINEFPVSDLITIFNYADKYRLKRFVPLGETAVFTVGFDPFGIGVHDRKEYERTNRLPPKAGTGWQL